MNIDNNNIDFRNKSQFVFRVGKFESLDICVNQNYLDAIFIYLYISDNLNKIQQGSY